ncbi:heme-binding protein [Dyadobacter sp. CY261]|uniref:heme-binding protein n=1 Tax=Dyadobacter sp. CY261 TaxID=2907203 RepID=UPI001F3A1523|nr:heme-binding protein [Dyadobacter sp. CY261]MCF0074701.1 heme-binding protein [Dyadobacter sp. CY261]
MLKVTSNAPQTIRLGGASTETNSMFGPLTDLIGTWVGNKGWNLVAVPNQKGGFLLLVQPYTETLTITPLSTPTPNRGTHVVQQVPTLLYSLRIHSNVDGSLLHAENGTWLLLNDCPDEFSIARQASVPHGDSLLALGGSAVNSGAPNIPEISTLPITGPGSKPLGYTDPYLTPLPGFTKTNPNATLQAAIAGQTITSTTTISVSTANKGGITNIPFIVQNANTTSFEATFWIETVENANTGGSFQQLQYSQTAIIEFIPQFHDPSKLIQWPHVNINTLVKQ